MEARETIDLILIASDEEATTYYLSCFDGPFIRFHTFDSLQNFKKHQSSGVFFRGLVIELKIALRASSEEKKFLDEALANRISILKVSRPTEIDKIADTLLKKSFKQFLKECQANSPRGLRTYPRRNCVVPMQITHTDDVATPQPIRVVASDVSSGGCFLTSCFDWAQVKTISLIIGQSTVPIKCRIAWRLPWGSSKFHLPGFGVEFLDALPNEITQELQGYL